jgi:excinuclease UvrABC nuclease subunit
MPEVSSLEYFPPFNDPREQVSKTFDKKFGPDFLKALPKCPAVYRFFDANGFLIYIGKAKDLRKRIAQYRNVKRSKSHRKMRSIVLDASRFEFELCTSEAEALLKETLLIQEHRPRWNVASAYYFLYPLVGVKFEKNELFLCYTTEPEIFKDFEFHGSFRSRRLTRDAFYSATELLSYVFHRMPGREATKLTDTSKKNKYTKIVGFRQADSTIADGLKGFLSGKNLSALEALMMVLIENASARSHAKEIQDHLNILKKFYRREVALLTRACQRTKYTDYPVPQKERDLLFLRDRFRAELLK